MHPQFDGVILEAPRRDVTRLPGEETQTRKYAAIRAVDDPVKVWPIHSGLMHVGRLPDNDLVISEPWVSGKHAEIFCRNVSVGGKTEATYFLRDYSRYGTFCCFDGTWQHIHREEVALNLGTQLRFGSEEGRLLEFIFEGASGFPKSGGISNIT
jgi:hypothetical protein